MLRWSYTIKILLTHSALTLNQAEEICLAEESTSKSRGAILKPTSLELKKLFLKAGHGGVKRRGFPSLTKQVDMQKKKLLSVKTVLDLGGQHIKEMNYV